MNRNETQDSWEPRIDRRFWFGPPAVIDTGAERFALRRIQIAHDTPDVVDVEVSFLNKPAIHRKVTETRRLSCQVGGKETRSCCGRREYGDCPRGMGPRLRLPSFVAILPSLLITAPGNELRNLTSCSFEVIVFPNGHSGPLGLFEKLERLSVPLPVALDLLGPERGVAGRKNAVVGTSVPKTSVHENCDLHWSENDICASVDMGKRTRVDSIPEPSSEQGRAQGLFRLRVTPSVAPHRRSSCRARRPRVSRHLLRLRVSPRLEYPVTHCGKAESSPIRSLCLEPTDVTRVCRRAQPVWFQEAE